MKHEFELRIGPGGAIEAIYQDGLAQLLDAETVKVERASNVEWEENGLAGGWTVRAAHDRNLAVRAGYDEVEEVSTFFVSRGPEPLMFFVNRETALQYEQKFFWELMEKT